MKVQLVTPYRVSHLQRYGVTVRGNVTSVYQPLVARGLRYAFPKLRGDPSLVLGQLKLSFRKQYF
jgi:hypothetical protein